MCTVAFDRSLTNARLGAGVCPSMLLKVLQRINPKKRLSERRLSLCMIGAPLCSTGNSQMPTQDLHNCFKFRRIVKLVVSKRDDGITRRL